MTIPVSFPIAKLLKEKRFDEYCNQHYSQALFEGTDSDWEGVFPKYSVFLHSSPHFNSKENTNELWFECSAPTIAEVVMWLNDTYGIWIYSSCDVDGNFYPRIYFSKEENWFNLELRSKMNAGNREIAIVDCKSPTLSYETAIEYCLTKLI